MLNTQRILLDESPFVLLTRNDPNFSLKAELSRFAEKCRIQNPKREYQAYSTKIAKLRLGYGWIYNSYKSMFTRNQVKQQRYQKRLDRREIAKHVIIKFLRPKRIHSKPLYWSLMDLHLFANENKRESLGRPLTPTEVIPFDCCVTALIANQHNLPLFSFNEDYEHFIRLPRLNKFQYWKPTDILKNMSV